MPLRKGGRVPHGARGLKQPLAAELEPVTKVASRTGRVD